MSEFKIEVDGGATVRLPTGGKYCPQDILVTGKGGDTEAAYMEGYEIGAKEGAEVGYNKGKAEAIESLPGGYIKVDPTWTSFDSLCLGRPSIGLFIKYGDTANGKTFVAMCNGWTSKLGTFTVPSWDLRNATTIQNMFIYSDGIEEIGEMNIPNVTNANNAFSGCTALKRISFAPGCIRVSIGLPQSNLLNDASIQSIIDGLADLTGKTAQTLTLHATVGAKLTDAQKASATAKNWTLAY